MNATSTAEHEVLELETIDRTASAPVPAVQQGGALASSMPESSPFGMMLIALGRGASLDLVESAMKLQERWEANEARKAFVKAMADFKAEPLEIFKRKQVGYTTDKGGFVGYKHAELSHITDVVVPAMARHGLSHRWDLQQGSGRIVVTCTITHRLGHSESVSLDGAPDNSGKKNGIQQVASTITYLQRYTLLAATGLATKDDADDDGRSASGDDGQDAQQQRASAPPPPAGPTCWPADLFAQRLPEWRAAIAAGRAKADQVIAKARTKYPLSDEQITAIRAPASGGAPGPTYAQVADQLHKAVDEDALNVAADLIKAVADATHRTDLNALYDKRRAELNA